MIRRPISTCARHPARPTLRRPAAARNLAPLLLLALLIALPAGTAAQGLKVAVGDVGLGIGPVPRIDGVRLNFRDDDRLERVRGINVTIWAPRDEPGGEVIGLAVGLPLTGAGTLEGIGVGGGIGATHEFRGVGAALLGLGAGGDITGIAVSGLGTGAGGDLRGLMLGGLGVGGGGALEGITVGGIGVGAGGSATGLLVGGVGAGVGGDLSGLALAGLGVGAGGDFTGIGVGGGGIGAGGDLEGIFVAGLGIGSGSELRGIALAGLGVGAPRIEGLVSALGVGGVDVTGVVVAPAYFRLVEDGRLTGVTVSTYNDIRGAQHGLAIGLVNITEELHGLQIGLVNIARNKERFPVLPLVNFHR